MKQIMAIAGIALLFTACKSGSTNEQAGSGIKNNFLPYLGGTWVMTDYINDLKQTHSPLASSAKLKGVVSMTITGELAQRDTLPVSASLNNHEGLSFNIIFKPGQNDKQLTTDLEQNGHFYELGYSTSANDTFLVLHEYSKDKKPVSEHLFTKVTGPLTEDSEPYGLQYMTNKTLMAGNYNATDDKGKASVIGFTEDGMLTGVEGHKTYYVFTDFIAEEPGYLIDELCFDEQTKTQKPFIFKINADTVRLYEAKENEQRTKLEQGALKYTLVRQR